MAKDNLLKNKFCTYPFEYLEASVPNDLGFGQFFVCCPGWLPHVVGSTAQSPQEIWNSEILQKIRETILDGTFEYCRQRICSRIQDGFLEDRDEIKDPYWRDIIDNRMTTLERGPRIINFANDLSCNLSCPSCRREVILTSNADYHKSLKRSNEKLLDYYKGDIRRLIICSAGDPFAAPSYREMLFGLDGSKHKNLEIQIVTNGMLFTDVAWKKMHKIHGNIKSVCVSVDAATPEVYADLRRGGDFSKLMDNLKFISELRHQNKIQFMQLDFVVQKKNYLEMKRFVELGKRLGVDHVFFQRILNDWNSFTDEEFLDNAVYLAAHPENDKFVGVLKDKIFNDPIVKMGNVKEFVPVGLLERMKKWFCK